MALVTQFCYHKHGKNPTKKALFADESLEKSHVQLTVFSGAWRRLFASKPNKSQCRWVPALSGIVEAGDEGLYSSTLFTSLHEYHNDISYESLLEVFANSLRARPIADRSTYSQHISGFLSTKRSGGSGPGIVRSRSQGNRNGVRTEAMSKTRRKSVDSSTLERTPARSMSMKRPALVLIPTSTGYIETDKLSAMSRSWMENGVFPETQDGATGIRVTPAELTALSLILGSPLDVTSPKAEAVLTRQGALGISISSKMIDFGEYQVVLNVHRQSIAQLPASGSGFSPLLAKHLAFGSLPFLQDTKTIHSILITDETIDMIQTGRPFFLQTSSKETPQWRYFAALPHSRNPRFYVASSSHSAKPAATLIDTIANLSFTGGLTPLASSPLVTAVRFVASGGLPPGRLLQRLEGLVDKVHKHSPHLNIFGPLYEPHNAGLLFRERERLGKLVTDAVSSESLADRVARMHRYTTLLERLMAMVSDIKSHDVLAAVKKASRKEMQYSYAGAVAAHTDTGSGTPVSAESRLSAHRSSIESSNASGADSNTIPAKSLGQEMEPILKSELPLSIEAIAMVARMVLVAWTLSVEKVAWGEGEGGFRLPDLRSLPEKMILC